MFSMKVIFYISNFWKFGLGWDWQDYYLSITCLLEVQFVSIIGCYSCHKGAIGDCYIDHLHMRLKYGEMSIVELWGKLI